MDDSMRSEVVKLMLDELERVQARNRELLSEIQAANKPPAASGPVDLNLYALQQENGRLKAEVAAAHTKFEKLPGRSRDEHDGTSDVDPGEGEDLTGRSEALETELVDRVSRARERYKRHKSSKYDLEEEVLQTQKKLEETAAEREREEPQVQQLKEEAQRFGNPLSEVEEEMIGATGSPQFDPVEYLRDHMPDTGVPMEEDVLVSTVSASATGLPNAIGNLCAPHGLVMRRSGEVIWPSEPPSRTHCIFFSPTHRYDTGANDSKGKWTPTWDMGAQGETKEVFYLKAQEWFYAGTYKYQKQAILPFSEIHVLEKHHQTDLQQRAIVRPDMVAPILVQMMRNMYDCGALKIVCTGWRRVGFNHKLADVLKSIGDTLGRAIQRPHPGGTLIQVPKEGSRNVAANPGKREHEETETEPRKKHKKK